MCQPIPELMRKYWLLKENIKRFTVIKNYAMKIFSDRLLTHQEVEEAYLNGWKELIRWHHSSSFEPEFFLPLQDSIFIHRTFNDYEPPVINQDVIAKRLTPSKESILAYEKKLNESIASLKEELSNAYDEFFKDNAQMLLPNAKESIFSFFGID